MGAQEDNQIENKIRAHHHNKNKNRVRSPNLLFQLVCLTSNTCRDEVKYISGDDAYNHEYG